MAAEDYFNKVDYRNNQNAQIDGDSPWDKDWRGDESGVGTGWFGTAKNWLFGEGVDNPDDIPGGPGQGSSGNTYPGDPTGDGGDGGGDTGAFDSANFDVQDKNQVMELQKQLFPDDPSQWDGMFGPNTQGAYRNMVNQQRTAGGQDAYTYGGPQVNDTDKGLLQVNPISQNVSSGQTPFAANEASRQQHQESVGQNTGFGDGQGWFNQMGQGGECFMGKFGTGEGWLSRGKDRRAARKALKEQP